MRAVAVLTEAFGAKEMLVGTTPAGAVMNEREFPSWIVPRSIPPETETVDGQTVRVTSRRHYRQAPVVPPKRGIRFASDSPGCHRLTKSAWSPWLSVITYPFRHSRRCMVPVCNKRSPSRNAFITIHKFMYFLHRGH